VILVENRKTRYFEGKISVIEKDLLRISSIMILDTRNKRERQLIFNPLHIVYNLEDVDFEIEEGCVVEFKGAYRGQKIDKIGMIQYKRNQ
jgi:hypothetical protein